MKSTEQPFISLCVVTRNSAQHIPLTLNSTHKFVDEVIVADLGSKDGTQRIAKEFEARVLELSAEENLAQARQQALNNARGKWILQLDPGHELFIENTSAIRRQLNENQVRGYYLLEYSLDNPDDFYYKPLLYQKSANLVFIPVFDESPVFASGISKQLKQIELKLGLFTNVKLFHRHRNLRDNNLKQYIKQIVVELEKDPNNFCFYYYLAFFYKQMNRMEEYNLAIQKGIQIMTNNSPEEMLTVRESAGLFGFFAEILLEQNITATSTINSLVQLQESLIADIRLNTHLAMLLYKTGRTAEAINLLQEAIQFSFRPAWTTLSFYESFVTPVYHLLEIIRETGSEEDLLQTILNIQNMATKNSFFIRPLFTFLNECHPDFLNMIDGILKRKLVQH